MLFSVKEAQTFPFFHSTLGIETPNSLEEQSVFLPAEPPISLSFIYSLCLSHHVSPSQCFPFTLTLLRFSAADTRLAGLGTSGCFPVSAPYFSMTSLGFSLQFYTVFWRDYLSDSLSSSVFFRGLLKVNEGSVNATT